MKYRAEIDGLRAVAVLPVILFHAGFGAFAGGYVGVDVFFVISGYLITLIILGELEEGRFSIQKFYERRARRILPALFFMMLCCLPFAWAWMVPQQFHDFSRAIVAVVLFVSNILFWRTTGYFDPRADENPLLHTWSLAIEEQFYIGFPILLLLLWRFGRNPVLAVVIALSAASLLLAEWASRASPEANFYLLPTRAWELGAGAICAFLVHGRERRENGLLAALGLGMIVYAVFAFDGETRFPSLWALLPVGGTALVILYGGTTGVAGRILASPPFVGIGLISYSAYLWHQPLFAFARIRSESYPSAELMLALGAASLVLAYLSWRFVEQPFRRRPVPALPSSARIFAASGAGAAAFLVLGAYGVVSDGRRAIWEALNPERAEINRLAEEAMEAGGAYLDDGECAFNFPYWSEDNARRITECAARHGPGIVITGDSHAIDFFNGMYLNLPGRFLVGLSSSCRPYTPRSECPYDEFLAFMAKSPEVFDTVIHIQAGYPLLGHDAVPPYGSGREIFERYPETHPVDVEAYHLQRDRIEATVTYLQALPDPVQVIWIGPRIEPHISRNFIMSRGCEYPYQLRPGLRTVFEELDDAIGAEAREHDIDYVSQIEAKEFDMETEFINCDTLYWRDGDHWSLEGARIFVERILGVLPLEEGDDREGAPRQPAEAG